MYAYVDPETGQVEATYTHGTESTWWDEQGFELVEVPEEFAYLTRDHAVTLADPETDEEGGLRVVVGDEPSVNPVQPTPPKSDRERIADALDAKTITEREALQHFLRGTTP